MDTDTSDSDTDMSYEEMRPFQCGKCCNRFITQNELKFHTELVHSKGLYQCAKCDFSCRGIGQMTLHNQNHIRENRNHKSYRTTPSQNSFGINTFQSNYRNRNGHIKGSSSGNSSDDEIERRKEDESESNKENKHNSCNSDSSSDSDSDSDDVSKNKKQSKIESEKKKNSKPISICSSTSKKRNIYERGSSSNNLYDNVSIGESPEITNSEAEIKNSKTKLDKYTDVVQSKYNDSESDSDFHDKRSHFDNEENNVNNKSKSPNHSRNSIASEEPKKDKFSLRLDVIQANFKNNDDNITNKTDTSKLLTVNTNPDKNKKEMRFATIYKNSQKGTEIECKDKQKGDNEICKSHHTSDSENENKLKCESDNKKKKSNTYAKEGKIKDNDKTLYERRKLSHVDYSKNEKQKHKSHSERHESDPKSKAIDVSKNTSKNKNSNLDKSEKTNSHNKQLFNEKRSNKTSDSENEKKQKCKSKSKRDKSDTESDNKHSNKSTSENKKSNSSKSRQKTKDRAKNYSERSPDLSDSKYESEHGHKLESSNSKTESKNKEKKKISSQKKLKSNPIKTNDASNKEEKHYEFNKKNVKHDYVELKKKGEKINEKENDMKQNEENDSNNLCQSEEQDLSSNVLKRKLDKTDIQNAVKKSKACNLLGNNVPSLDSEKNESIALASLKTLSSCETPKSMEKQPENLDKLSFREKDLNRHHTNEMNSVNKLGKEILTSLNKRKTEKEGLDELEKNIQPQHDKTNLESDLEIDNFDRNLEFDDNADYLAVNSICQGEKNYKNFNPSDVVDLKNKPIIEKNGNKQTLEQSEIKIKTEVSHNDQTKEKGGFRHDENGMKSSKPMCKIPKENIKEMISNNKGTNTSEREKGAKITKIEEIDEVIQQCEDVIVGDQPNYKCKTCCKSFERKRKLKKHLTSGKCFGKGSELTQVDNKSNDIFVIDVNPPSTSRDILNEINPHKETAHFTDNIDTKSKSIKNKKSVYSTDKVEKLMAKVEKKGNQFQCPECSKMLNSSGIMKRHLIIHTGEMPFMCTSCDSTFNQKIQLQKHMKNAHNEGMFRCTICNENFVQEIYMRRHMAKHTGINPFPCAFCQESFVLERDLKKHMRKDHENWGESNSFHNPTDDVTTNPLHNEKKSDFEGKTSTKLNNKKDKSVTTPKNSLISHTGKKPFKCIKCNYISVESKDFQNHLKNVHNEGIFKCMHCDETFSEKIILKTHISEHARDKDMHNLGVSIKAQNQIFRTERSVKIENVTEKHSEPKYSPHRVPELDASYSDCNSLPDINI